MQLNTYVHYNGNCDDAFRFYEQALGGKIEMRQTYGASPAGAQTPPEMKDKIIHARIRIGDTVLMGSDAPPQRRGTPDGFSLSLSCATPEEAERVFAALSDGGRIEMPMAESFFAHRFGMLADKFGMAWMVVCQKEM
ncbi:MAG TPA: VOC family protein [Rhizomicrobium sp.]|nr:VOC family protein [Rhizomicrobium sp.]